MNTITLGKESPDQSSSATTITDLGQTTPLGKGHRRGFPDRIASLVVALFLVGVSTLSMAGQDRMYQPSITTAPDQASSEEKPHLRHQTSTLTSLGSYGVSA